MDGPPDNHPDGRVLVLAPVGRDAALADRVLGRAGIATHTCPDIAALCAGLGGGAAAAVLTEEALTPAATQQLLDTLTTQPPWSDLPLVVLTTPRAQDPDRFRVLRRFEQL